MNTASRPSAPPANLVVVLSGRGRNLDAIIRAIESGALNAHIRLVASNRRHAGGLDIARQAGLPITIVEPRRFPDRAAFDTALAERVAAADPDWIVLAGYMRILSHAFVQQFAPRLVNIHPSLLPRYKGLDTHARVLANGDERHGATVHFVSAELDSGPPIRQGSIAIHAHDTPQTLAERLMQRVERRLYPAALADLIDGRVIWHKGHVWRNGHIQAHCLHEDYDPLSAHS